MQTKEEVGVFTLWDLHGLDSDIIGQEKHLIVVTGAQTCV